MLFRSPTPCSESYKGPTLVNPEGQELLHPPHTPCSESYKGPTLVNPEGQELLEGTPEYDYLTHIVFRMYEKKSVRVQAGQVAGEARQGYVAGVPLV